MKSAEQLLEEKNARENQKKREIAEREPDQVEIPAEMPRLSSLDTAPDVFARKLEQTFGGINTRESVFDRTAVFLVSQKETEKGDR